MIIEQSRWGRCDGRWHCHVSRVSRFFALSLSSSSCWYRSLVSLFAGIRQCTATVSSHYIRNGRLIILNRDHICFASKCWSSIIDIRIYHQNLALLVYVAEFVLELRRVKAFLTFFWLIFDCSRTRKYDSYLCGLDIWLGDGGESLLVLHIWFQYFNDHILWHL